MNRRDTIRMRVPCMCVPPSTSTAIVLLFPSRKSNDARRRHQATRHTVLGLGSTCIRIVPWRKHDIFIFILNLIEFYKLSTKACNCNLHLHLHLFFLFIWTTRNSKPQSGFLYKRRLYVSSIEFRRISLVN